MTRKQRRELKNFLNAIEADTHDLLLCVSDEETDDATLILKAKIIADLARGAVSTINQ